MPLTSKVEVKITGTASRTLDLISPTATLSVTKSQSFANGTGANQANIEFTDTRTLNDGANETLDFHDGSLYSSMGVALVLTKLKALLIHNKGLASLQIGGAATAQLGIVLDGASDKIVIKPGGVLAITAPDANGVDVSTNSKIKITHAGDNANAVDYDIVAVGVQ
jgi:hypothetical protein